MWEFIQLVIVSNPKVERLMAMEFQLLLAMMFGLVAIP